MRSRLAHPGPPGVRASPAQDLAAISGQPPGRVPERARIRLDRHSERVDELRFKDEPEPTKTQADRRYRAPACPGPPLRYQKVLLERRISR